MPKHLNWLWTLQNLYFCFVSYLTQRGDDVHKDTRITEKKRFQQDDVMQSKVEKHGVARPSTLMLHCCTSTAQLALSADSWGSKLKAIICKLTHNFIGWTLTTFTATCREKLWKIKRQEQQRRSRRCTRISKILTASIWLFLAIILVFRPAIMLNSCNSLWKSMRCYSGLMEPAVVYHRIEFWMCCDDKRSSEWIIACFTVISVKDLLSV